MILNRILKLALIYQWMFLIAAVIAGILEEKYLPANLAAYVTNRDNAELSIVETLTFVIGLVFLFAYFVSSIGLLLIKHWAPKIYLFSNIVGLLIIPFIGIEIKTPLSSTLDDVTTALIGFTICLIYLSPLKEEFKSTPNNLLKEDAAKIRRAP